MWTYQQSTGLLTCDDASVAAGYSGLGEGKDNPALQAVHNVGPIPQGFWKITGDPFDSPDHGPYCLRLEPLPQTDTFGRDGFLIHGDSKEHPGRASKGCIILPRNIREDIFTSGDRYLKVIA